MQGECRPRATPQLMSCWWSWFDMDKHGDEVTFVKSCFSVFILIIRLIEVRISRSERNRWPKIISQSFAKASVSMYCWKWKTIAVACVTTRPRNSLPWQELGASNYWRSHLTKDTGPAADKKKSTQPHTPNTAIPFLEVTQLRKRWKFRVKRQSESTFKWLTQVISPCGETKTKRGIVGTLGSRSAQTRHGKRVS
jgi:hypothetical protein